MAAQTESKEKPGSEQSVGSGETAKQKVPSVVVPESDIMDEEPRSKSEPEGQSSAAIEAESHQKKDAQPAQSSPASKKNNGLMLVIAGIVVIAAAALTYYAYKKHKDPKWTWQKEMELRKQHERDTTKSE